MLLVFTDTTTVENLRAICLDHAKLGENSLSPTLDSRFFGPSPSQVLYLTEVRSVTLLHLNSANSSIMKVNSALQKTTSFRSVKFLIIECKQQLTRFLSLLGGVCAADASHWNSGR